MKLTQLFESNVLIYQNRFGYSLIQYAFIKLWGGILYLDYDNLPSGPGRERELVPHLVEYLEAIRDGDNEKVYDLDEWFQEGAKVKGPNAGYLLTRDLFDRVMHSAETKITEPLTLYKDGSGEIIQNRWISTTLDKSRARGYHHTATEENISKIVLQPGSKVIYADGIADKDEVIINTDQIK